VTLPDETTLEYLHDPLGRRIAKKVDGIIVEKYLWQGLTRLLSVYDGSDNLLMRFEYADDRMPVAVTTEGGTYYLGYDQVGSLRVVADSAGDVVKRIDYDSFGNIIDENDEAFKIPFGFAGGLHDRDTGLVRFGYRDYDPDVGRWTAKDPIFFAGGDTDLYGYVLNDPVNLIDPFGFVYIIPTNPHQRPPGGNSGIYGVDPGYPINPVADPFPNRKYPPPPPFFPPGLVPPPAGLHPPIPESWQRLPDNSGFQEIYPYDPWSPNIPPQDPWAPDPFYPTKDQPCSQ
jgi:RHS repeat-associated protein